ncbi:hypothetical protein [Maioricimonas sp. JC845]|uniref:hypothetical protein n=1 Tax=Maioricimonas sp. JC845 TaxID=3232138 RepID=UPI0034584E44
MAEASIPVDLLNPGQVFACLGFLEAADVLIGNAEGGFDWADESKVRFRLRADGQDNPFELVLDHLASATITEIEPDCWPGKRDPNALRSDVFPSPLADHYTKGDKKWSRTKLPCRVAFKETDTSIALNSWCDGSSRPDFKLYAGNRTGTSIAHDMLFGKRKKPTKRHPEGPLEASGLLQLWETYHDQLVHNPFHLTCPLGGTFNMDPRGGWVALDLGFSPNELNDLSVESSPIVEILAVLGLEHARPDQYATRKVRYAVWTEMIPALLARAAFSGVDIAVSLRTFHFTLDLSGKNKVVTFATPESQ